MKYVFYFIALALIFLGIMSCMDSKPFIKEDNKPFDYNKDSKPSIVEDDKSLETTKDSKPSIKNPILYKGTPVYEAAQAIVDKNNVALRAWAAKASDELLNFKSTPQGNLPLNVFAYKNGNIEAVKILTEAGADPNLQSDGNRSVFLMSCLKSKMDNSMMTYLLVNGGNPNAESSMPIYRTPLIASSRTNLENVKILENGGANINYIWKYSDGSIDSPLLVALRFKKIYIVNYYIFEKGLDFRNIDRPSLKSGIPPRTILTYLRRMNFKPGTEKHQAKWKLINYLKEQGLDYKKQPIPKTILRQYDKEFLDAY